VTRCQEPRQSIRKYCKPYADWTDEARHRGRNRFPTASALQQTKCPQAPSIGANQPPPTVVISSGSRSTEIPEWNRRDAGVSEWEDALEKKRMTNAYLLDSLSFVANSPLALAVQGNPPGGYGDLQNATALVSRRAARRRDCCFPRECGSAELPRDPVALMERCDGGDELDAILAARGRRSRPSIAEHSRRNRMRCRARGNRRGIARSGRERAAICQRR